MADDPLFIIVAIACIAVLIILLIGIGSFAKGGDFNRKHANRIAVILILIFVFFRRMGGA